MKKFLSFVLVLNILVNTVQAAPVSPEAAQQAAQHFLSSHSEMANVFLEKTYYQNNTSTPALYIFSNTANAGFVIVSADDVVQPVLGYSFTNPFIKQSSKLSPEVDYWLKGYSMQISDAVNAHVQATTAIQAKWQNFINVSNGVGHANKPTGVAPMLTTIWNQLPWYNDLCPVPGYDESSTPTGCVATAMAQIMKYWNYPTQGSGSHSYSTSPVGGTLSANFGSTTYDWGNMPDELNWSSNSTEINAIATLMYHCGVAVNMGYNIAATGSGAWVTQDDINGSVNDIVNACSQNALRNYFGYKSSIRSYSRFRFTDSTWHKMLLFEIDNGRPLLYVGYGDLGGHAFVFDGYDDNEMFHVNWGWDGASNGYFEVANLNPPSLGVGGGGGNFNTHQEALVMIEPGNTNIPINPYQPDISLMEYKAPELSASEINQGDPFSVTEYLKNTGSTTELDNTDIYALLYDTAIANDSNGVFTPSSGFEPIIINQTTHTFSPNGTYDYQVSLSNTNDIPVGAYYVVFFYQLQGGNYFPNKDGSIRPYAPLLIVNQPTAVSQIIKDDNISVYPNPAHDYILIDCSKSTNLITTYRIINMVGQTILSGNIDAYHKSATVRTNSVASGNYILQLESNKGNIIRKITVRN